MEYTTYGRKKIHLEMCTKQHGSSHNSAHIYSFHGLLLCFKHINEFLTLLLELGLSRDLISPPSLSPLSCRQTAFGGYVSLLFHLLNSVCR